MKLGKSHVYCPISVRKLICQKQRKPIPLWEAKKKIRDPTQGERPETIRQAIAAVYDYDLSRTVDTIRPDYDFNESCQRTVPAAITCALESDSIEDAVSLGGDADTLVAIAGAIAEAMHGIPETLQKHAVPRYFTDASDMLEIIQELYSVG